MSYNFFIRCLPIAGDVEVRAWTIRAGTSAPAAAGVIHSDFEKKVRVRSFPLSFVYLLLMWILFSSVPQSVHLWYDDEL